MEQINEIARYNKRLEALKQERSPQLALWRELADFHLSNRSRFLDQNNNQKVSRSTEQLNNVSHLALRTLASGMMSGVTSPARPWFRLGTNDPELREYGPVRQWLHDVQGTMYTVFAQSNVYNALHVIYKELGAYGTAATGLYDDFENVIHSQPMAIGSYMLAMDGNNKVDTMYREFRLSVAQTVKRYGYKNVSSHTRNLYDQGGYEKQVKIVHLIEPNSEHDPRSKLARDMQFASVHYEAGGNSKGDPEVLRRSGFKKFRILAPRWEVTAEDVYASDCPGMVALGDTKALQLGEKRLYQAVDRNTNGPLQAPSSLRNMINKGIGNDQIIYHDGNNASIEPIYNHQIDVGQIAGINANAEERIRRAFYEDLFLMIAQSDRRQQTAREVAEKHEEKLLMLGPVLERLHTELLDPLIDITFTSLQSNGVLPPPPPEIANSELKVEYVSVLAQAQRLVSVGALDRLTEFTGGIASVWPEARHKIDPLQMVDEYAEALGTSPGVVRTDDEVQKRVQDEQQQAAQEAALAQGQQLADTFKTASEADVGPGSAMSETMKNAGLA